MSSIPFEAHDCGPSGPAELGTVATSSLADIAGSQPKAKGATVQRRIVGLDLGVATDHTAGIYDETGAELGRRRASPTRVSLEALRDVALAGAEPGTVVEVVIEPTGPAWLPVAVFFTAKGDVVYRVSSQKAADLRRYFRRHHKTNRIDAAALARIAILEGDALRPVELARGATAALDREVRVTERITEEMSAHKVRIRDLARQLMPTSGHAFSTEISRADLAVLATWGDPRTLVAQGIEVITDLVTRASTNHHGRPKAQAWLAAATEAVALYGDTEAVSFGALAAELATEISILRSLEAARAPHERRREELYAQVDPEALARSLPGIAHKGGPLAVAVVGRAGRFPNADAFASYTGLVPKASETGETDHKGQAITKAGNRKLRRMLYLAADAARKQDPQLAHIYWVQMVERGANHTKALCVVAVHLARRLWRVLESKQAYELRDVDGRPVDAAEAKAIIAERYTVTEDVRRRRRSKKAGKAPQQVLAGHERNGAQGASTRRPSPSDILAAAGPEVNGKKPLTTGRR
jgi:transposase